MADSSTVGQRIAQLIQQLGISKNAFAISLDKTATVIQHLVDERNKPGFDLLCKIFDTYPNVSKDWLLQGIGPMLYEQPLAPLGLVGPPAPAAAPANREPAVSPKPATSIASSVPPNELQEATAHVSTAESSSPLAVSSSKPSVANEFPATATPSDTGWQTTLYTQQMAHQLALAELRNQHMQEQQRLMQQMLDLMQRQLSR